MSCDFKYKYLVTTEADFSENQVRASLIIMGIKPVTVEKIKNDKIRIE